MPRVYGGPTTGVVGGLVTVAQTAGPNAGEVYMSVVAGTEPGLVVS